MRTHARNVRNALQAAMLIALPLSVLATSKAGWTCNKDGFWYDGDKKTTFACDNDKDASKDKKTAACTRDDPSMPHAYPKTCIAGPPDNGRRCWYTHEPASVKASARKVPLIIGMHGGGGCASHNMQSSGFKELADTESFIVVWPQGYPNNQWGTCGSDCDKAQAASGEKKGITKTDDLTFLSNMVAQMAKKAGSKVDPERVYSTGFSMGCMMSHRLAMERSKFIAGFGCHGGTLIEAGSDLAAQKKRFNILPMPAYMTGGTKDTWFKMAAASFKAWAYWDNCSAAVNTTTITLTKAASTGKTAGPTTAVLSIRTGPAVQVASLNLTGGFHTSDSRMAKYTWDFLKKYKRSGALAAMPAAPPTVPDPASMAAANAGVHLAPAVVLALCMAHWLY